MPDICTCGAQLPPDALFCHKCGKPQREILVEEPVERRAAGPPPAPPTIFAAPAVSPAPALFQSRLAMNIGLKVALGATLFFFLPYVNWLVGGFFSVFLYRRRTGQRLNLESGVRIGWITGLLMFPMFALLFTGVVVMFNTPGFMAGLQAHYKVAIDPQVMKQFQGLSASGIVEMLIQLFVMVNLLSMAGGAIGAKMTGRR